MALAFGLLVGLAILLFGVVPLVWIARGYPGGAPAHPRAAIRVYGERAGSITYREGEDEAAFAWAAEPEGGVAARIDVPSEADWPATYPWAVHRREDVLDEVAAALKNTRLGGRARWEVREDSVELYER